PLWNGGVDRDIMMLGGGDKKGGYLERDKTIGVGLLGNGQWE
ncbi:hypothetical protein A2U01_0057324, partial [Trifolium medium]|nr:hypothetical protein [Trifolium medium]